MQPSGPRLAPPSDVVDRAPDGERRISGEVLVAAVQAWRRLEGELSPRVVASLRPPPTREVVRTVERVLGAPLPEDFAASLAVHDGQRAGAPPLVDGWALLRLTEVMRYWNVLRRRAWLPRRREGVEPDVGVQPCWFHPRWIPIAVRGAGEILCLDLAPTVAGVLGQIVAYRDHEGARRIAAASFAAWLAAAPELVLPVS